MKISVFICAGVSLLASSLLTVQAKEFSLTSPDITPNGTIPTRFEANTFGCHGENRSPELNWSDAPADTQSFALTVYDPDAPTGSGWWHWMVLNIPANVHHLPANAGAVGDNGLPKGATQVRTDYGVKAWGGTCPPVGDKPHRYIFTLYALKASALELPTDATAALGGFMINANALAKASFTGYYGR
ncbi:YbhB/YbcL family Raf kinase inhibitor-like protein [Shewanella yunxiaonensis]|uniref:YbhB/YbcL family Raf kinase inhibitor-like protein n=1 Tax=Shewanella yunxiaonensis TaxID=2829809 RepID=A0ABX7YTT9_9GAMM|nr:MULTISPECIES: YbhB/YbcL family Raf kinase inhibitor-like protein [Shewanella]MDF0535209.1 YbhB/YbcL family Raf kinase inhibitor-like protein [Shewanella sp. A32]QUN05601.1 YbhB/YbcL family Raf kinase inhibitor-like protein [Shewanella yunxiaonensis]